MSTAHADLIGKIVRWTHGPNVLVGPATHYDKHDDELFIVPDGLIHGHYWVPASACIEFESPRGMVDGSAKLDYYDPKRQDSITEHDCVFEDGQWWFGHGMRCQHPKLHAEPEDEPEITGKIVTAAFVDVADRGPDCGLEDCECPDHEDKPRPAGTYVTVRLDEDHPVGLWNVALRVKRDIKPAPVAIADLPEGGE